VKVVVTGNCQARPLADMLGSFPNIEVSGVIILHLSNDDQASEHQELLSSADFIVAQQTAESFSPMHLNSNVLKTTGRAIIWPNIFFCGQQPYLKYITSSKGRLLGPLDVYHDLRILELWHKDRFGCNLFSEVNDDERATNLAKRSLIELLDRERSCDISLSGKILAEWETERLFFTFNHPSRRLLFHAATQIAGKLNITAAPFDSEAREPLDKIIPPSVFDDQREKDDAVFQGVDGFKGASKKRYSWQSLVEASFEAYDLQREIILGSTLRLTPSYA